MGSRALGFYCRLQGLEFKGCDHRLGEDLALGKLGRPSGHFIFSLIGLMRILFSNIVQRL